jgi:hypothetical protein
MTWTVIPAGKRHIPLVNSVVPVTYLKKWTHVHMEMTNSVFTYDLLK